MILYSDAAEPVEHDDDRRIRAAWVAPDGVGDEEERRPRIPLKALLQRFLVRGVEVLPPRVEHRRHHDDADGHGDADDEPADDREDAHERIVG